MGSNVDTDIKDFGVQSDVRSLKRKGKFNMIRKDKKALEEIFKEEFERARRRIAKRVASLLVKQMALKVPKRKK